MVLFQGAFRSSFTGETAIEVWVCFDYIRLTVGARSYPGSPTNDLNDIQSNLKGDSTQMAIEEGKAAPAFTLNDTDGNKVALKDYRNRPVVSEI